MADAHGSFHFRGHRIVYDVHGEGDRALVLIHGLLMNRRMYDRLAPEMAERGHRVITVDLLGHGESDKPDDMRIYSMGSLASQAAALVDHLGLQAPVVGGTSLGANVALELAVHHPDSAGALFIEMPVLEDALLGAAMIFTPILLTLRFGGPILTAASQALQRVPRTHYLLDIGLDWLRRDPRSSRAVLRGGPVRGRGAASPRNARRIRAPRPRHRASQRPASPVLRRRHAGGGDPQRPVGRRQLDFRVARHPHPPEQRAGGLPGPGLRRAPGRSGARRAASDIAG